MDAEYRQAASLPDLFLPQRGRIEEWLQLAPDGGMLVVGPSGSGKSRLVGAAVPGEGRIRLDCFPGVPAAEILAELAIALVARGEERLNEGVERGAPFSVLLELAKEALSRLRPALWLEDLDHLGRGALARFPSQDRERAEFLRLLGVVVRHGVRVIATAESAAGLDEDLMAGQFAVLPLPHLARPDLEALWAAFGPAGTEPPGDLALPLAVRLAGRLAYHRPVGAGAPLEDLFSTAWSFLSEHGRRLAVFCAHAEGRITRGLVRYLERSADCAGGAWPELVSWGILEGADGASNRVFLNPALAALIRERAGESPGEVAGVRATLGDFWKATGRRAHRVWDLLRAARLYGEAGRSEDEHELQREIVEELLRRDYLDLGEELLRRTVEQGTGRMRAVALGNLAIVKKNQGRYDEALSLYEEAWEAFDLLRDQANVARVLHQLGNVHYLKGDLDTAYRHYEQSRRVAAASGDASAGAAAQIQSANVHFLRGEFGEAAQAYQESLAVAEGLGDRRMTLAVMLQLGQVHFARESLLEADEALRSAARLAEELGDALSQAKAVQFRGLVARSRGDLEEALGLFGECRRLSAVLRNPLLEGTASYHAGQTTLEQGDLVQAIGHLARAAEIFEAHDLGEARAAWASIREVASRLGGELFAKLAAQAGVEWILTGGEEDVA
jgi:tetratricopeptide (TPR) repeat protein